MPGSVVQARAAAGGLGATMFASRSPTAASRRSRRAPSPSGAERFTASRSPACRTLHSHAFQRGMAGLAERRGAAARQLLDLARDRCTASSLTMTPGRRRGDRRAALCRDAGGGLHPRRRVPLSASRSRRAALCRSRRDGRPRSPRRPKRRGIGLTLLPVFYAHSDFGGAPPLPGQRRFICDLDLFARLVEASRAALVDASRARSLGVAPHSLRAVTPERARGYVAARAGRAASTCTSPNR